MGIGTRFQSFRVGGGPGLTPGGNAGRWENSTAAPGEPGGACADRIAQPVTGMRTIAAYSTKWARCAVWRSHGFMSAGYGGGLLKSLQTTRATVSASTVNPEDACNITATNLTGSGQPSMKNPVPRLKTMNAAIAQCKTMATRV